MPKLFLLKCIELKKFIMYNITGWRDSNRAGFNKGVYPMKNRVTTTQAPRTKLMKLLDGLSEKRLIYIHAPAGYGKTVSAQLALGRKNAEGVKHAWITLDEYDNQITGFCKRFAAALLSLQPGNAKLREVVNHPSFKAAADEFAIHALSEFSANAQKYILVIDDLHVIRDESVLKLFRVLYGRLPPNFTVFLLSRSSPPDIFAELTLKDALAVVGTEELRFSDDEIKAFFDKNGHCITRKQADDICRLTGGWAIGLRALLISGGDSRDAKLTDRYLEAFLKEHVWEKWDKRTRTCMMKASVATELTPNLFNALAGVRDGGKILAELAIENAFLRTLGNGAYKFHDLFRDFLMNMLEQEGNSAKSEQRKKAGDWFYKHKDYYRAVEYYFKCGDTSGVAKCLKLMYNHNSSYASIEDTVAIIWLSVSNATIKEYPFLLETLAWAAYVEGRGVEMEDCLDRYFKQLPRIILQNPTSAQTAFLLRIMDYRNSMIEVTKSLKKLPLKLFTQANTPSISQNMPFAHRCSRDFSEYAPDNINAFKLFRETIGVLIGDEYETAELAIRAGLAYECGNINTAHEFALSANAKVKEHFSPEIQFCAFMILAAVLDAFGRRADAEKNLEAADAMIERYKAYYLNANFRAFYCRLALADGDVETAQNWIKGNEESPYNAISFYKLYRHFTGARAYIVIEDYNTAILYLKKLLELSQSYRRPLDIIEACTLLAIAYRKKSGSGRAAALEYLEQAISEAYKYGYTQIFTNEGADLVNMLHIMQKRAVQSDFHKNGGVPVTFIKSLYFSALAASKRFKGLGGGRVPKNLNFTKQQKIVMRSMCDGCNRNEIAEIMGISPDGVKSHVKLIYKKLDVSGSADAVVKIKELGILAEK